MSVCVCLGGRGQVLKDWESQPEGVGCGFLSGQGAVVHHVLTFPASVSYFCRDTTADDPEHSGFNTEGFNLAQCWTPTVACNSLANTHAWNKTNYPKVCLDGGSLGSQWPKNRFLKAFVDVMQSALTCGCCTSETFWLFL